MPIPDFQSLMLPVLKAAASDEVRLSDLVERLADDFHLTDDERHLLLPSGHQTTLANRTGWAKTYLVKAGLLETTRRGYFQATERGRQELAKSPERINIAFLSRFPEFDEFRRAGREPTSNELIAEVVEESNRTPDELLRETHQELQRELRAELLDRVIQASPSFFENTIVRLLKSMN